MPRADDQDPEQDRRHLMGDRHMHLRRRQHCPDAKANLRHHDIEPVFNDDTVHGEGPDFQWKRELTLLWDLATVMEAGRGKAAGNEDRIDFGFSVDWTHDTADGPGLVSISRRLRETLIRMPSPSPR